MKFDSAILRIVILCSLLVTHIIAQNVTSITSYKPTTISRITKTKVNPTPASRAISPKTEFTLTSPKSTSVLKTTSVVSVKSSTLSSAPVISTTTTTSVSRVSPNVTISSSNNISAYTSISSPSILPTTNISLHVPETTTPTIFLSPASNSTPNITDESFIEENSTTDPLYISYSTAASALNSSNDILKAAPIFSNKTVWLTEYFSRAKESFKITQNASLDCQNDYNLFKLFAKNQTVWAVRMLESSEWPLVGLFSGKLFHTGDYDECLRARGPSFTGKYCLVKASLNISTALNSSQLLYYDDTGWPNEDASAWDIITLFEKSPKRKSRSVYTWALCLPSSCSTAEIRNSVDQTLVPIFEESGLAVKIDLNPYLCSVKNTRSYPIGFYCAWLIFILIISLVVTSTIYDFRADSITGESDCWLAIKLFKCFSIRHSYVNLTHYTSPVATNPGFYLIKIIYFFFIVVGHRMFINGLAFSTSQFEELEMTHISDLVYLLNMDVIDIFFMLTGFLTFHLGYLPMRTVGYSYFFMSIGIRWLKLMPVYALLLLFVTQIFPYTGEGPWWKYRVLREVENCRATWWTQLFALSNIVNSKQQCLMISWYLSVEIQLAIIGAIVLLISSKNRKMGFLFIILAFFIFTELSGIIAYRRRYHGTLLVFARMLEHLKDSEEFYRYHISGVTRVGPYLIGFAAAFIAKVLKDKSYQFSNRQKLFIIAGTYVVGRAVLYYGFVFYSHQKRYIPLENAVYAAIHRPLYVLPVATTLCIYFTSGLGIFNQLFEMKIFIPFGRLVYSAFLVHCVVQLYNVSVQRGLLLLPKTLNLSYTVTADIIHSFIVGFFLFIIAEGPFHSITHLLHPQLTGTRRKSIQPLEEYIAKRGFNNKAFTHDDETTVC